MLGLRCLLDLQVEMEIGSWKYECGLWVKAKIVTWDSLADRYDLKIWDWMSLSRKRKYKEHQDQAVEYSYF